MHKECRGITTIRMRCGIRVFGVVFFRAGTSWPLKRNFSRTVLITYLYLLIVVSSTSVRGDQTVFISPQALNVLLGNPLYFFLNSNYLCTSWKTPKFYISYKQNLEL